MHRRLIVWSFLEQRGRLLEQLRRSLFGHESVHGQEAATEGIEHGVFRIFLFVSLLAYLFTLKGLPQTHVFQVWNVRRRPSIGSFENNERVRKFNAEMSAHVFEGAAVIKTANYAHLGRLYVVSTRTAEMNNWTHTGRIMMRPGGSRKWDHGGINDAQISRLPQC